MEMNNIFTDSDISGLFQSVTEIGDATPYKINVTFRHRLRIWQTQILPDRENAIRQENSVEFIHRMMDLLFTDGDRLTNRAIKEDMYPGEIYSRINIVDEILKNTLSIYLSEIDRIKLELDQSQKLQGDK